MPTLEIANQATPSGNGTITPVKIPPLKLDIGCGSRKQVGFTGVDIIQFPGVDIVVNLAEPKYAPIKKGFEWMADTFERKVLGYKAWPWKDNTVDEVNSSHCVEHFTQMERVHFFNELYRVMKPGSKATIITPDWSSGRAYGDPTHCFSEDTEILTETGWKLISDCKIGERVPALDLSTEKTELVRISEVINQTFVGHLLHFQTERMDLMVTDNHDLVWRAKGGNGGYWGKRGKKEPRPILRKSPAESFVNLVGHHPRRAVSILDWSGDEPGIIRISSDEVVNGKTLRGSFDAGDFAELLGWFVSEGNVDLSRKGHYHIQISQSSEANGDKVEKIVALIRRLGLSPTVYHDRIRFSSKPLALFLSKLGLCADKFVPLEFKQYGPKFLKRILDSAILGDGRINNKGWEYATISKRLADDIQEIALKCGHRSTLYVEKREGYKRVINGRDVVSSNDIYIVGISRPTDSWYPSPVKTPYSGNICCVTLEKLHTVFVRRNGRAVWSGNCWPAMAGFFWQYVNREWRESQAPHSDSKHLSWGLNCNFQVNYGWSIEQGVQLRNQEYQQHALQYYKEAAQDMIATLVAVK